MKLLISCLLLTLTTIGSAQSATDSARVFFQFGFGYHRQSFDGINTRIQNRPEYEKLEANIFSFSLGHSVEHKKVLLNTNILFGSSLNGNIDKRSSSVSMLDIGVNLGYNFSNNQKIRVYPFAGVSYNVYMSKLNKDVSAIPFDSVLQSNAVQQRTEPLTFTNGFFCYQGGIGIDFVKQKNGYMRTIGIKASYTGSFSRETWRINETQLLQNAPSDKISQFNISLQFGIGRNRMRRM
jgi:hypothetical protein